MPETEMRKGEAQPWRLIWVEGAAATGGNSTNVAAATVAVGKKPRVLAEGGKGFGVGRDPNWAGPGPALTD